MIELLKREVGGNWHGKGQIRKKTISTMQMMLHFLESAFVVAQRRRCKFSILSAREAKKPSLTAPQKPQENYFRGVQQTQNTMFLAANYPKGSPKIG